MSSVSIPTHPQDASPAPRAAERPHVRPPRALVVRDPSPNDLDAQVDWSAWHLTDEDDMGESLDQGEIIRLLLSILTVWVAERGWDECYLGADNFFAWREETPLVRVSPDVYLLFGSIPQPRPDSWQTWQDAHRPPHLAFEIASDETYKKDYDEAPEKYAALGAHELIIFDPHAHEHVSRTHTRVALQRYVREDDGLFVRYDAGEGPVRSSILGAWIQVISDPGSGGRRLRLARDADGHDLVPTLEEARLEAERRATQEREARLAADDEIARLRQEIEALRRNEDT